MSVRLCSTCHTKHEPPTGRHCKLANETPLPKGSDDDMESAVEKKEKLKAQIEEQERILEDTNHILALEKRLTDLKLEEFKLQEQRQALAQSVKASKISSHGKTRVNNQPGLTENKIDTSGLSSSQDQHGGQVHNGEHGHLGLTGFTIPGGSSSDSSDSSDSSVDSHISKHKKKSKSKRRKKLLRLNNYSSAHRKPKTFEECVAASMGLATKLLQLGYDIKGYLEHIWFISEQAALGRFRPECILQYDQAVRDKASIKGLQVFGYGDAENFYRHLGSAALNLKKDAKTKSVPPGRYNDTAGRSRSDIKELRICGLYNHGQCQYGQNCFRKHVCFACQQPHPRSECPNVSTDNTSVK